MTTITLRAWGRPLAQNYKPTFQNLDHTWVTDFPMKMETDSKVAKDMKTEMDSKTEATPQRQGPEAILEGLNRSADFGPPERFWNCRGLKHKAASRDLGAGPGIAEIAENISPINSRPSTQDKPPYHPSYTSGSIVYYGLDGLSHNIANQVLSATGTARSDPLRVQEAKGYALSSFFFSTYGLNTKGWALIAADNLNGIKLAGDDFLNIMDPVVPKNKQALLLDIRADMHADLRKLREDANASHGYDYFPKLFKIALKYLSLTELRIGTLTFEKLFSKTASRDVSWLHPEGELSPEALEVLNAIEKAA